MSAHGKDGSRASYSRGHEQRDISLRPIAFASVGLIILIFVAVFAMRSLFSFYLAREIRESPAANPLAAAEGKRLPPEPRLLPKPIEQLRELRAQEDRVLKTYGWVDREHGIVRIPIERAMELVAERRLAVAPEEAAVPAAASEPDAKAGVE